MTPSVSWGGLTRFAIMTMCATYCFQPTHAQTLGQGSTVPARGAASVPEVYRQAPLDPTTAMIAYNRLSGITPDFNALAEKTKAYRDATAFDRDQVRAREAGRLETIFRRFDPNRIYLARVNLQMNQYDMGRRGYALPLNETSFVQFADPLSNRQYGVQFRNFDDVNFISIINVAAARSMAERFGLNMQYQVAGTVVLEVGFRMVDTSPEMSNGPLLIRAEAVAARVMKDNRQMHEFTLAPPVAVAAPGPNPGTNPATALRAGDIQGIRLGMTVPQAQAIAARNYPVVLPLPAGEGSAYFDVLAGDATGGVPACGIERAARTLDLSRPTKGGRDGISIALPNQTNSCLVFIADKPAGPAATIRSVASSQRITAATRDQLRAALVEKYGTPADDSGNALRWIGTDPQAANAPVQIEAQVREVGPGTGTQRALLLAVEVKAPAAEAAAPPPQPGAPRL